MPETPSEVAENCPGGFVDYHGPLDGQVPEGAWLYKCSGCGEVGMLLNNKRTTLIPGR